MATSNMKRLLLVAYISTFSLMTPLGIGIGMALTETVSGESDASGERAEQLPAWTVCIWR